MLNLPPKTFFDKRIPKHKFYENLDISTKLKSLFVEQIKTIRWQNKLSEDTINIKAGRSVSEIQFFLISLNQQAIDENVLIQIDQELAYHIVFLLKYQDYYQLAVGYKEKALSANKAFKVAKYYYTDWLKEDQIPIKIRGLDLDTVYENLLRDIAGDKLGGYCNESIVKSVERDIEIKKLENKINKLKQKRRKEKQLNKQVSINDEIRKLQKQIDQLVTRMEMKNAKNEI